jgi:hypothetical protein
VEVLTTATLFTTLLTGIVAVTTSTIREYARGSAKMSADDQTSVALQKMCREIRAGTQATINSPTDLTVTLPYQNSQGDYERYMNGSTVRYYLSNGNVYRQVNTAASTIAIQGATRLLFSSQSTSAGLRYQVSLTCRQRSGTEYRDTTLTTTLSLRNEPTS